MQRRPKARSKPRTIEMPCDMLEGFRFVLAHGLTRQGRGYVGPGPSGAVISDAVAQYLVDCGIARRDGDSLVLNSQ
jgi:hypothetical protein